MGWGGWCEDVRWEEDAGAISLRAGRKRMAVGGCLPFGYRKRPPLSLQKHANANIVNKDPQCNE
jgi:hypothetical protein